VYIGIIVRNDGALRAVKKLYIRLYAARDTRSSASKDNTYRAKLLSMGQYMTKLAS
jgi:hypothetical protein